ncbi:MAG: pilus assembly protein TadG-related protein [Gammaproteobacteria bacterium]
MRIDPERGSRRRQRSPRGQRGQAIVLTYLFAVVLVLAALSLFRTGRLTGDKMELQNAADAVAYSISTVEARDLNFAAYTNRAIVANEVAIGQAIGMASWAYHWKSIGDFLLEYNNYLAGPTLGISTTILTPLATGFQVPGGIFISLMRGYAKAMTAVNHNVNKAYGIAQQIYHLAAVVNTLGLLDESIKANAPDGAHMSGYGVLMLMAHLASYGGLPVPVTEKFTQSYNPKAPATPKAEWQADTAGSTDAGGYGRLAATIHNSGDPFTKGWHNPPDHTDPNLTGRGWIINFFELMADAGLIPSPPLRVGLNAGPFRGSVEGGHFGGGWLGFAVDAGVDFGVIGADVNFYLQVRFRMLREGGSELRATIPIAGAARDKVAGELFSWSSADSTNFDLGFRGGGGFDAWIRIPFVGKVDLLSANVVMQVADERMFLGFGFGGGGEGCSDPTLDDDPDNDDDEPVCEEVSDSADIVIYDGSFPTSAPLGASFVWSGKSAGAKPNALTAAPQHMGTQVDLGLPFDTPTGPIPNDAYGHAAQRLLGWYYPPSVAASGIYYQPSDPRRATQNVGSAYKGLPRYIDTTGAEPLFKSGGPFLVVGLTLDEDTFEDEHYDDHPGSEPAGRFELEEAFGWDSMGVMAKSEVHFERPRDIAYFARGDGYVEHGSAFNPYWQGRLIETSHADRVLALLLQNGELAQEIDIDPNVEALYTWLAGVLGL